jgi:hypothetical protein
VRLPALVLVLAGALVAAPACANDTGMALRSESFEDGGTIPIEHSCEGENASPPLSWTRVPEEAEELALVVADPDAATGVFHHWVVVGIRAADGSVAGSEVPEGAVQALGSSENATWIGPCPPHGDDAHDYVFTLYPLDRRLGLADGVDLKTALDAIDDARIDDAEAELVGRYALRSGG